MWLWLILDDENSDDDNYDAVYYTGKSNLQNRKSHNRQKKKNVFENPYYGEAENMVQTPKIDEESPQHHEAGFSTVTAQENVYYEESTQITWIMTL